MAPGGFAANGDGNEKQDAFREVDEPEEAKLPDPSVLEDVLQETIASDADAIQPEQMEALREVARRHGDAEFDVDPIGVGLAEAILSTRYKTYSVSDEQWRGMSFQVAESLFEAENIRVRIKDFWIQLCESTR